MNSHPHWNLQEFTAFLLLYGSSIDTNISAEEEGLLLQQVDEAQLDRIREEFDKTSDYGKIQTILTYKKLYFADEDSRQKLFDKLRKLFQADGKFSVMERELFHMLNKIL